MIDSRWNILSNDYSGIQTGLAGPCEMLTHEVGLFSPQPLNSVFCVQNTASHRTTKTHPDLWRDVSTALRVVILYIPEVYVIIFANIFDSILLCSKFSLNV